MTDVMIGEKGESPMGIETLAPTATPAHRGRYRLATGLRRAWAADRPLTVAGLVMLGVLAATAVGLVLDPRVITGAPAWLKPAKFAISISIYSFTFLWLLTYVEGRRRLVRAASWVTAAAFVVEMAIIVWAAAMGTTSHFNVSTPLHAALWSTMGASIVALWLANLLAGVLLLTQRMADTAFAWSLRLGIAVSAAGMALAFLMTAPTGAQLDAARTGEGMTVAGAHSVGVADGGPGLPIVGWSTEGGDLRAAHFLGLHALQVLPLLGAVLTRFAPAWLRPGDRTALVWTAGLSYLGFVGLLTWQALRGQPLVGPDRLTLGALAVIVVATAVAAAAVLARARRRAGADGAAAGAVA
jgi:hypothetical protein